MFHNTTALSWPRIICTGHTDAFVSAGEAGRQHVAAYTVMKDSKGGNHRACSALSLSKHSL